MKVTRSEIKFKVGEKHIEFIVIHDLPDTLGLSFEDALQNWLARTTDYTGESLCEYILSKNTGAFAVTEEWFLKFKNETQNGR